MSATGADALLADAAMAYALAELAVEPVEEAIVADDSVDFLSPVTDQPEDAKYLSIYLSNQSSFGEPIASRNSNRTEPGETDLDNELVDEVLAVFFG